jgi:hypothetical protein
MRLELADLSAGPTTLAPSGGDPRSAAQDDDSIYWIDSTTLKRMSKDTGQVTMLAADLDPAPAAPAVGGGSVFITVFNRDAYPEIHILQYPKDGGGPLLLAIDGVVDVLAADETYLYWGTSGQIDPIGHPIATLKRVPHR